MKPEQTILARVPSILFFVTGIFWAGIIVTGGGLLLGWAILSCFVSGILLMMWTSNWITRPLVAASCLFGVVLTAYQLYVGLTGLTSGLPSVAIISVPLFLVFTFVHLYLFYACTWRREA